MNETIAAPSTAKAPLLPRDPLLFALADPRRWAILAALSTGEALMVKTIARRVGCSPALASKHLAWLRRAGAVVAGEGGLYRIPAAFRPEPARRVVDFGHCRLRFDAEAEGAQG